MGQFQEWEEIIQPLYTPKFKGAKSIYYKVDSLEIWKIIVVIMYGISYQSSHYVYITN